MADRYIPEHRRTQFKAKHTFKPEELRRRREEQQVEIRKAKREENLAKRRGIGTGDQRPGAALGAAPDSDDDTAPTETQVSCGLFLVIPLPAVKGTPATVFQAGICDVMPRMVPVCRIGYVALLWGSPCDRLDHYDFARRRTHPIWTCLAAG